LLKQRVLTSLLLAPAALAAVLWLPPPALGLLLALFLMPAAWEWSRLAGVQGQRPRLAYVLLVALGLAAAALALDSTTGTAGLLGAAALFWTLAALGVAAYQRTGTPVVRGSCAVCAIGLLVLCMGWAGVMALHGMHPSRGPSFVILLFALIWGADIAAYFTGRRYGRRKLAPRVSPGKTWEGLGGALAAACILGLLAAPLLDLTPWQALGFLILCGLTVIYSVAGDLVESLFKRMAGLKDSGTLLPGHGGVLDRIDSLTAAAPVFALGMLLLGGST
jgi:phosphatidate cytidylyltransferase